MVTYGYGQRSARHCVRHRRNEVVQLVVKTTQSFEYPSIHARPGPSESTRN